MPAQRYQQRHGCLLLAKNVGSVIVCGAFRSLQAGICEMKRLYVLMDIFIGPALMSIKK